MHGEGPHALFVMGEHGGGFACGEVPEADGAVEGGGEDLRVGFLALDAGDGALVAGEHVDVGASAHVPHSCDAVTASCDEDVEGRV